MFKYLLAQDGASINWMAIFSLVTFFVLFVISVLAVWGRSKQFVQHMAELPLDNDE